MALILSIETATTICSIALHQESLLVAHYTIFRQHSHAESVVTMIDQLLKLNKYDRKALAAVAVSSGPGSYTGLRIGASVAKGLCYGLGVPLIAIPTLEALAHSMLPFIKKNNFLLCPTIDAKRKAIYTLVVDSIGTIQRPVHVALLDNADYLATLPKQPLLFVGDGAWKCQKLLIGKIHRRSCFLTEIRPSAVGIGALALAKFQQKSWGKLPAYEPYYLSQFQ